MNIHDQQDSEGRKDMDSVRQAYRDARGGDGMTPPPALDDAIRAAARRAVRARPQPAGSQWMRRWTPQLALAAVVVLSVSVVFVAINEQPELAPAPIQKVTRARQADVPATMAAEPARKQKTADTGMADQEAHSARRGEARSAKEESRVSAATPAVPAQPAVAPAPAPMAAPPSAPLSPAPALKAENMAPAPFPATVTPARTASHAEARAAFPQELAADKVAATGAPASGETSGASMKLAAPVIATPRPLAKQPAPAARQDSAGNDVHASGVTATAGVSAKESRVSGKVDDNEPPGPWLKRLLELREQGKFKELREELVRFRKIHPDVALPKSLTELPAE